jgi:obg-like ATPase 1
VEGDVDPIRDLSIISDELRIKDMEFVEKHLDALKKITARGGQSLEVKAKKEEQATVEKVLKHLQDEKDVRKGDWNNKEVNFPSHSHSSDDKEPSARYNPSSSSLLQ